MLRIKIISVSCEIASTRLLGNIFDEKSTLVQVTVIIWNNDGLVYVALSHYYIVLTVIHL